MLFRTSRTIGVGVWGRAFSLPSPITAFLFVPFLWAETKKRDKYPSDVSVNNKGRFVCNAVHKGWQQIAAPTAALENLYVFRWFGVSIKLAVGASLCAPACTQPEM